MNTDQTPAPLGPEDFGGQDTPHAPSATTLRKELGLSTPAPTLPAYGSPPASVNSLRQAEAEAAKPQREGETPTVDRWHIEAITMAGIGMIDPKRRNTGQWVKWDDFLSSYEDAVATGKEAVQWRKKYYDVADAITRESHGVEDLCQQAREIRADRDALAAKLAELTKRQVAGAFHDQLLKTITSACPEADATSTFPSAVRVIAQRYTDLRAALEKARLACEAKDSALREAIAIAKAWIHGQLDGTEGLDNALAQLRPLYTALSSDAGAQVAEELERLRKENSKLTDRIDLMRDEFQRIAVCPAADSEIKQICERASAQVQQHVPVIVQRDEAQDRARKMCIRAEDAEEKFKKAEEWNKLAAVELANLRSLQTETENDLATLTRERDALRADMDWLETQIVQGRFYRGPGGDDFEWRDTHKLGERFPSFQAAVTAARQATPAQEGGEG